MSNVHTPDTCPQNTEFEFYRFPSWTHMSISIGLVTHSECIKVAVNYVTVIDVLTPQILLF